MNGVRHGRSNDAESVRAMTEDDDSDTSLDCSVEDSSKGGA